MISQGYDFNGAKLAQRHHDGAQAAGGGGGNGRGDNSRAVRGSEQGGGITQIKVNGQLLHRMGSLRPEAGQLERFAQLYMLNGDEATAKRFQNYGKLSDYINAQDMRALHDELTRNHKFASYISSVYFLLLQGDERESMQDFRLVIKDGMQAQGAPEIIMEDMTLDRRVFAAPATSASARGEVAAAIVLDQNEEMPTGRDICIKYKGNGKLTRLPEFHHSIDCLTYPLLLPYGENGYDYTMESAHRQKIFMNEFYKYHCQQRHHDDDFNMLFRSQRLMQEYFVSSYARVELKRLEWFRFNQKTLRADLYTDDVETGAKNDAKKVILPSGFIGGPRWYSVTYQDTLAIAEVAVRGGFSKNRSMQANDCDRQVVYR
jgi:hypothetical protein